jgi:hypothetical protein
MSINAEPYATVGRRVTEIPVRISYRIIELFSAGLYSSPNKAIEELVSNSYDALASHVDLLLPANLRESSAAIWVVDNGSGMDVGGLFELWQIARSAKRDGPSLQRAPIGKFGIGKLATYVLAHRLTHISQRGGVIRAVTMDYSDISPESDLDASLTLEVRELTAEDLAAALQPMRATEGGRGVADALLAAPSSASWTIAALSRLKAQAAGLRTGRIRWLLSTALPMSPAFTLSINGRPVEPTLAGAPSLKSWQIGENPDLPDGVVVVKDGSAPSVRIEGLGGPVTGAVEVFRDVLTSGKAADLGRSHGFFVMVRGRLINLDDALFGLPALSFSTFNRFRMIVNADGLDDFLASTREAVVESPAVNLFREYLRAEFNAARTFFDSYERTTAEETRVTSRLSRTSPSVLGRPLVEAIRALLSGAIDSLSLIEIPRDLSPAEKVSLLDRLDELLEAGKSPIQQIELHPTGVDRLIASYDPLRGTLRVNTLHPFFANFIEDMGSQKPFELIAVAEVLTAAYLLEEGIEPARIARIMERRDQFLRGLVSARREGPAWIAQNLRDQVASQRGLEEAVADAFRSLGLQVSPKGGNGQPDGVALATLGVLTLGQAGRRDDYSLTYDAKSTAADSVSTHTIGVSTLARHRDMYSADFSVVVAVGFEGSDDRDSPLGSECVKHGVVPITADDLALLVQVAALRQIGFRRLREWLETCRTPGESRDWIRKILAEPYRQPPVRELLDSIAALQKEGDDPVEIPAVVTLLRDRHGVRMSRNEVEELIHSMASLAPGYITLHGQIVILEISVEKIKSEMARHHREFSPELITSSYLVPFLEQSTSRSRGTGARRTRAKGTGRSD